MSTVKTYSGTSLLSLAAGSARAGDTTGGPRASIGGTAIQWNPTGGGAPTFAAFLHGTIVAANSDLLLANADPFQSMGDSVWEDSPTLAGLKVKEFCLINNDPAETVTIEQGATNGLAIFAAAGDGIKVKPNGGRFYWYDPAGVAFPSGSGDKVTLAVSGGTPSCDVFVRAGA
jgi:hypothetical protein